MPAVVVAVVNKKGGVGKTSTVFHLSGYFSQLGMQVLVVDNDPQGSLTKSMMGPHEADAVDEAKTIAALYDDCYHESPHDLIRPSLIAGIDIVPGSDALTAFNLPDPSTAGSLQIALREFVDEVRDNYDLIVIDNPPNLQLCSWAALIASDQCLVALQAEDYGSQGAAAVRQLIAEIQQSTNVNLRLSGFLLNQVDARLSIHKTFERVLRETYGDEVFMARIPMAAAFKEAVTFRLPVTLYKPKSKAADAVRAVGQELLHRLRTADARLQTRTSVERSQGIVSSMEAAG